MATTAMSQSSPAWTASMDVPQTQNTAPVLEFRCLFTSDLRRKQKRWQDGRLKFHTFNKRVMVYDDRSNFVGDTHWRRDHDFEEGEELELERGGILVEVAECVGKRDQDLTELVDKRVKDREERVAAKNANTPIRPGASISTQLTPAGSAYLKPKSLNAVLGNPTGHYGKAVIPQQSPFEQRQQAIRDTNENERPAKRRKQDETPPSKHGYAQSLIGTRLNLSSSKTSSKATIRYEPLRHIIQRPPTATIDLTGNDESYRTIHEPRIGTPREERPGTKAQRQRSKKSPARNGYASNLTGASLSLTRPEGFSSKRSFGGLSAGAPSRTYPVLDKGSSSSVEPDALIEDTSSDERPARKIQKQKAPTRDRENPQVLATELLPRSLSPPVTNRLVTLSKTAATSICTTNNDCPAIRLLADKPVSTLRIKSRPPRKMMFIERSLSRSSAHTESLENTHTGPRRQHKPAQNIVLSQATTDLDAFREQQQRRLGERLNKKQPEIDFEELSSSPVDSGINHQMIDTFLSRKTKASERASWAGRDDMPQRPCIDFDMDREDNDAARIGIPKLLEHLIEEVLNRDIATDTIPEKKPPEPGTGHREESHVQEECSPKRANNPKVLWGSTSPCRYATDDSMPSRSRLGGLVNPVIEKLILNTSVPEGDLHQGSEPLKEPTENVASHGVRSSPIHRPLLNAINDEKCSRNTSLQSQSPVGSNSMSQANNVAPPDSPSDGVIDRAKATPSIPEMEPRVAAVKAKTLPPHMSGAIISATAYFRAMIKSSASPPNRTIQELPLAQPDLPRSLVPAAGKLEPASNDVAIEPSTMPSALVTEALGSKAHPDSVSPTIGIETETPVMRTILNSRTAQPKAKLINPATRGLSVQMTASRTVNGLVPAFNGLPSIAPPQPHITRQPGEIPAQEEALANQAPGVKEVTAGGPWSRESFDLFGFWRPPTGPNAINASN